MRSRWMAGLIFVVTGACGLTEVSVEGELGEQRVDGDIVGGILGDVFVPIPVQVDVQSAIEAQNLRIIKEVFLDNITLNITDTANQNGDDSFDFIDTIDMFATAANDPELPRVLIGSLARGDDGATTIVIVGEDVNLKDYIEAAIEIEAEVDGSLPPTDTTFDGVVTLTVQAL
jgi:hypothetical protein